MREKLVLIDGHSILNRAFYGVPELTNSEGLHTNAVYGFLNILFKILAEEQPQYLAVAFDLKAPTFRHKMYDAYKGTRKPQPPQLHEQVPVMKEVLTAMGVPLLMKEGYEADDLLGTVAKRMEKEGLDVSVVSGDRDLLQLATDHIMIRIPKTKRTGILDRAIRHDQFGRRLFTDSRKSRNIVRGITHHRLQLNDLRRCHLILLQHFFCM